jgi:hypothetical protein
MLQPCVCMFASSCVVHVSCLLAPPDDPAGCADACPKHWGGNPSVTQAVHNMPLACQYCSLSHHQHLCLSLCLCCCCCADAAPLPRWPPSLWWSPRHGPSRRTPRPAPSRPVVVTCSQQRLCCVVCAAQFVVVGVRCWGWALGCARRKCKSSGQLRGWGGFWLWLTFGLFLLYTEGDFGQQGELIALLQVWLAW